LDKIVRSWLCRGFGGSAGRGRGQSDRLGDDHAVRAAERPRN
jgi:hypothetical protein